MAEQKDPEVDLPDPDVKIILLGDSAVGKVSFNNESTATLSKRPLMLLHDRVSLWSAI